MEVVQVRHDGSPEGRLIGPDPSLYVTSPQAGEHNSAAMTYPQIVGPSDI